MIKMANNGFNIIAVLLMASMLTACGGSSDKESDMKSTEKMASEQSVQDMDRNATVDAKLNINTATAEAFRSIPKVGDRMVGEFKEYRPYTSIQQFRREIGKYVDEDQVAEYEKYIYVPVHRNKSDAASLLQIPGLDKEEATKLVSGRPYDTNQAFVNALAEYVSDEELTTAEAYLKAE